MRGVVCMRVRYVRVYVCMYVCMCITRMNCDTDNVLWIAAGFQSLVQLICEQQIRHLGVGVSLTEIICI